MSGSEEFEVGVGVRIVPAGIETIAGVGKFVRAAVMLSPIDIEEAKKCGGTAVDIRDWPREIEKRLHEEKPENYLTGDNTALRAAFSGVVKEFGPASLLPEAVLAPAFRAIPHDLRRVKGKDIAYADWQKQREKQIDGITEMWSRLVGQGQPEAWTTIIKALKASRAEQAVSKYRPDPKNKDQAPDIRGIGRGQAALLLSVERGRSLLARIRSSLRSNVCNGRDDECNLATPIVPRLSSYLTQEERQRAIGLTRLAEEEAETGRAFNRMNPVDQASRLNLLLAGRVPSYLTESERARAIGLNRLAEEEAEAKLAFEQMKPVDRNGREQLLLAERLPSYLTEGERVRAAGLNRLPEEEAEAKRAFERMEPADRSRRWNVMLAELRSRNAQQAQADIQKQQAEIRKEQQAAAGSQDVKAKLAKAYEGLLACTEVDGVTECMMAAAAEGAHDLADAIDGSLGRHRDVHREDDEIRDEENRKNTREEGYERDKAIQAPQMRLAALQSQPSLARVFNLVVDVLIPLDKLNIADTTTPYFERDGSPGYARFGFLAAALNPVSGARRVWTTCKVKLASDSATPVDDLWPCTRAELDLFWALDADDQFDAARKRDTRDSLIARGALTQIDGFLNLSAARMQGGMSEPRFDIVSLDAPLAVETRETQKSGARNGRPPLLTQRTAGLAVIDRWRDSSALMQALNSLARDSTNPILDADDLTIGYRMDVGVGDAKTMTWRSLCSRYIQFGDDDNCIEPLLADIVPDPSHRLAYDSAIVVMSVLVRDRDGAGDDKKIAFVEDTVGEWAGPPIGVDTNSINIDLTKSSAALQLGHLYSLSPDPEKPLTLPEGLRIPRQVFGGGYFFKLAPRYLGGVVRPVNTSYTPVAVRRRETFAILPSPRTGARRFLRHERIEAPIVTTPLPILERQFDKIADGLRETASNVVVRSEAEDEKPEQFKPYDGGIKSSYRVVVPPSVSADFADRHNAFGKAEIVKGKPVPYAAEMQTYRDCDQKPWQGPADGLHGIDYDERSGGFPVYGFSATSVGRQEQVTNPQAKPSGDAIFRPRQKKSERRDPYYPDPAASYMVIGLRDLAGRMLPGDPLVVPVRPSGVAFPHVRPVAIEVVAQHKRSKTAASHDRILGLVAEGKDKMLRGGACLAPKSPTPATVRLDGKATIDSGSVPASHVVVALEPGESFEIDIWCVPTVDHLTRWFDAVESAALVASVNPETGESCMSCESFATQLRRLQLDDIAELARKLGRARTAANETICSSGGGKIPAGALRCVAVAAHELMLKQPTPELAARTTITATHAIPQVYAKPEILLTLRRETLPQAKPGVPAPAKQPSPVVIEGVVTVDRPTTGLFEVRAEAVSLVSCAFDDDQRRRRTPDEVSRGIWPRSPVSDEHMKVRDVYGFDVAADGTVTLPREQATLVRVEDDIAEPKADSPAREPRDLAKLRERAAVKDAAGGNIPHVNAPFKITDTRARILKLWAVAGSRTAASFRDEKGDVREMPEAKVQSAHQEIVLPASEAPAKVAPLTILPAFHLEQRYIQRGTKQTIAVERRVKLRIRMRRPWFTSGEGERLGIILWPPDILKGRVTDTQDSVRRDYEVAAGEKAEIAMREFRDEDIGPGGSYVTRWGLDPTKRGGTLGWITPPSAFADLGPAETDPGDSSRVVTADRMYVPRASIPIPIDDGTGPRKRTWLEAALLTFVPRFDIDHESWFCDVELRADCAPEPFMRLGLVRYQPYAPPELRVSEPVVEWLQIPQHRVVKVTVDKSEPQRLQVEMQGASFNPRQREQEAADDRDVTTWANGPVMKVSVLRRRHDGIETVADLQSKEVRAGCSHKAERTWLPRTQAEWDYWLDRAVVHEKEKPTPPAFERKPRSEPAVKAKASDDGTYLSWLADFKLNEPPLAPKEKGTIYRVLVEEVQPMLPATYDDEPHEPGETPPENRVQLTASGPRFAALLDVKLPDEPLPEQPGKKTTLRKRSVKEIAAGAFRTRRAAADASYTSGQSSTSEGGN